MHLVPIYLLDKEEILERAISSKEFRSNRWKYGGLQGVYFLISDEEIVYVGSSRFARNRLQSHCAGEGDKEFNRLYLQDFEDETKYRAMELLYIAELTPKYNKSTYSS